jgi:Zn-dependent peptidase ImmA (M78 family)
MHELAHIWLDHVRVDVNDDRAEAEANFLASYLLAPDALVVAWVPDLEVAAIAREFGISDEAARLAHGRVMRANTQKALGKPHDQRIMKVATRRVDTQIAGVRQFRGSA